MVSVTAHISGHCFHGNQPGACTDRLTEHTVSQGETDNYSSLKAWWSLDYISFAIVTLCSLASCLEAVFFHFIASLYVIKKVLILH